MTADSRHARRLLVREVEGEVLVLDPVSDRVHQLNASASLIWRMCERGSDVAEIAEALTIEFEVDSKSAAKDVEDTLSALRALNLLK
jgi:PqqD family protein of HPr-rel-A system